MGIAKMGWYGVPGVPPRPQSGRDRGRVAIPTGAALRRVLAHHKINAILLNLKYCGN